MRSNFPTDGEIGTARRAYENSSRNDAIKILWTPERSLDEARELVFMLAMDYGWLTVDERFYYQPPDVITALASVQLPVPVIVERLLAALPTSPEIHPVGRVALVQKAANDIGLLPTEVRPILRRVFERTTAYRRS